MCEKSITELLYPFIFLLKQICHLRSNTFCSLFISEMFKEFCAMVCYNIFRPVVDQKKILIKCFQNCAAWLVWIKVFSDWNDKPHYCYHDNKNASIKTRFLIWLLSWEAWDPCVHVAAWMTEGIRKLLFPSEFQNFKTLTLEQNFST